MARDVVAVTQLASGAAVAQPAGTAISVANGSALPALPNHQAAVVVRITNTAAADKIVTFSAGVNPPAARKGLGSLAVTVAANTGDVDVLLETARFAQADGTIYVDYAAGMTGFISAKAVPKAV